jgi:hypothetical protein
MQKGSAPLLVAMAVAAVVVAGLLVVLSQLGGGGSQESFTGIPQDGTRLGREDSPVTIRLYEDFQCLACSQFARETLPEVVERHVEPGEAKLVSETHGLIGPDSVYAARGLRGWRAGPLLAVRRSALRESGRGEQLLRHRRVPDAPSRRGRGVGYGVVTAGAKEKLRRGVGLRPAEELFVIRAICQWCMAKVAAVIAYLVFGRVRLRLAGSDALKTADRR